MNTNRIGRLFLIGFHGTGMTPELREMLRELNPAGVILFSRNIEDPLQIADLNRSIQLCALENGSSGMFIGVDQEGGRVRRLREPFSVFAPALDAANSSHPDQAVGDFARGTAEELRLSGFNMDFVPVLDVLSSSEEIGTSVIGDRSFGTDPATVARLGSVVIRTMRANGVIPCCKHFPGHGGTLVDSHKELPVDDRPAAALEESDLKPFRAAIADGVEMIMTAHVLYGKLDPERPASISSKILKGLLRDDMRFANVVISDDLEMGALAKFAEIDQLAMDAFLAGTDLLLICSKPEKALEARNKVAEAVRSKDIPESRIEESLARIDRLKASYASSMSPCNLADLRSYFEHKGMLV